MDIKQANQDIKNSVLAYLSKDERGEYKLPMIHQRPILMMGPPGIGKTQIMEQIAEECEIGLVSYTITHHTRQSAVGLPMIKEEIYDGQKFTVTEYTMSEIIASVYNCMRDKGQKEGILFIDEINCVSETLMPAMLQFLQCKTFGNQAVPQGWIIVAAGNPPEYNKSVRDFDIVTLDRVRYLKLEANYEIWRNYAIKKHVHGSIISYLELHPNHFYHIERTIDGLQFVTARGWEDLSILLQSYETLKLPITQDVINEYIRCQEIAEEYFAYWELYKKYEDDYCIPDVLMGEVPPEIYGRLIQAELDERISVVNLLLDQLEQEFSISRKEKVHTDQWYEQLKASQGTMKEEDFEREKAEFVKQTKRLQSVVAATGEKVERAFDFLEAAFGKGQELLVFVTRLTMGEDSVLFLASRPCERYLRYSEEFLTGKAKGMLLKELNE